MQSRKISALISGSPFDFMIKSIPSHTQLMNTASLCSPQHPVKPTTVKKITMVVGKTNPAFRNDHFAELTPIETNRNNVTHNFHC
jgi:hypothetical protein